MSAQPLTDLDRFCAAAAFADGLFKALMTARRACEPAPIPRGMKADDAAQFCVEEGIRQTTEERRAFFNDCLAKLDASLARIAASDDITRYSIAAE
ncbi:MULTISPECIES: hypothetical protein [unclassified Bosea (in: a-proteobacteria)]|uniref:hypothetical protein n=1 Tax=unclassified Bosea (in: a-proteobacteria) TaxID=2653178 RepID=UPI000F75D80B|nr:MULTISPECIES: hypothetical protein [unclassified Bosea (in: a-proteobacteria)]AZO77516.1 hypothetical protein BLM15_07725 [Bosea sp. Tri-49]RXT18124.1 hypothetical protein B5U98_22890 [Bosea sp. Tri-39]RXT32721.1 hypothetical protein B5U99_29235 [Bosea sp. Tri-54]